MLRNDRPYSRSTTELLWILAVQHWDDPSLLHHVSAELAHRERVAARILRFFVDIRIAELGQPDADPDPATEELRAPAIVQADEEFEEETRDYVQSSFITLWGQDEDGKLVRRRSGFLLDDTLVVTGSFKDDESVSSVQIVHRGDDLLPDESEPTPLDVHEAGDLRLYIVDRREMSSDWEMVTADITPPNVGDVIAVATDEDWLAFEFERVRELPGWGTVLELPADGVTPDMDGAPIVNEQGRLVGITRVRWVEGEQLAFGLPVRWLFDLFRGTLSSKLNDLRRLQQWDDWDSENWDEMKGMTRSEVVCRQRIAELESELLLSRQQRKSDEPAELPPPKSSWWRRLLRPRP
jgi:hypothetical protein